MANVPIPFQPFSITVVGESTIYQNEIRCHVAENDFNYSLNPTVFDSSSFSSGSFPTGSRLGPLYSSMGTVGSFYYRSGGKMKDALTGSSFAPYATTVGLYNEQNELLVVGKLATPYPIPSNTEMTFVIRYDS